MKIALFGATGRTGKRIIRKALERNYKVKVLVRDVTKLGEYRSRVEVVTGSLSESKSVDMVVAGCDVVINVAGHTKNSSKDILTVATKNILASMKYHKVDRLISLTGQGVFIEGDKPQFIDKLITSFIKLIDEARFQDAINFIEELKKSDVDWTVVRVPILTNSKAKDSLKIGMVGDSGMDFRIPREDVAEFILNIIGDEFYFKKLPAIASKK